MLNVFGVVRGNLVTIHCESEHLKSVILDIVECNSQSFSQSAVG